MRFGVQMVGLHSVFLRDKEAFLQRICAAGFRYAEPCLVLGDMARTAGHGWSEEDLREHYPLLEKYGVKIHSIHVFTTDPQADIPKLTAIAKNYGIRQIVLPCPAFESLAQYEAAAVKLDEAGRILNEAGLELLLRNSREDSLARIDGISAYEWMLRRCGSAGAQPDTGWLLWGGIDPEAFLWRNREKIRCIHYKDMEHTAQGLGQTGIGKGLLDLPACFQFARAAEIIQIAAQDWGDGSFPEDIDRVGALLRGLAPARERTKSILCIADTETGEVTKLRTFDRVIEAPNWMHSDGDCLIYNADGRIYKYRISTGQEELLDSGECTNCNNDHVLSPDNAQIAVSHSDPGGMSQIYILPIGGGQPRLITPNAPSYLHGWSPDGKELSYCAFRDHGNGTQVDVYAIGTDGGSEWQLTRDAGFNDGPEYAPDGRHIWFNSTRSGLMQCWRMDRDGSNPVQMTHSLRNNWFPHISPDGRKVAYLSYSREGLDPVEHLPNMHVELRLMDCDGSKDRLLVKFFGGQGSVNVNSWSRSSRCLAFVQYELEHK